MEEQSHQLQRPRRWRSVRAFSLRGMLLIVTALCIWFAVVGNRARKQRNAAEAVRAAGGMVVYDYHFAQNVKTLDEGEPPGPAWLREFLGVDFVSDVVFVMLTNPKKNVISQLQDFPALERLGLINVVLSDDDIDSLCRLTHLRILLVDSSRGGLTADQEDRLTGSLPNTEVTVP